MSTIEKVEHTLNDIYAGPEPPVVNLPENTKVTFTRTPHISSPNLQQFLNELCTVLDTGGIKYDASTIPETITLLFSDYDNKKLKDTSITFHKGYIKFNQRECTNDRSQIVLDACMVLTMVNSEYPVYLTGNITKKPWILLSWINGVLKKKYNLERYADISEMVDELGFWRKKRVNPTDIEKVLELSPLNNNFSCGHIKFCWDLLVKVGIEEFMKMEFKNKKRYFTEIVAGFIQCDIGLLQEIIKEGRYTEKDLVKGIYQYYKSGKSQGIFGLDSIIITDITPEALKELLNYLFKKTVVKKELKITFKRELKEDDLTVTGRSPEFVTGRVLGVVI